MADFGSPGTPSRHEKSLGLLTTKFVSLLQEAKDGVLDLKVVSKAIFEAVLRLWTVFRGVRRTASRLARFVGHSCPSIYSNIISPSRPRIR